ncbi:hypothetical protein DFP73DRAFT_588785 [Morchella snyderi]|nr:hypothetical protein DFP73DRAFT_588785 [Morchella snyderi]
MTLSSQTITLLMHAMNVLDNQMSPAQHALLSAGERRSTLLQLKVTTETAAKLADIMHVEAVALAQQTTAGAETERIRAETERLKAETEKTSREAEKVVVETERTRAEAEKVCQELGRSVAVRERIKTEGEEVGKEVRRMKVEVEEVGKEVGRMKMDLEKVGNEVGRAAQETEKMRVEVVRVRKDVNRVTAETQGTMAEMEKLSKEAAILAAERYRKRAVVVNVVDEVEKAAQGGENEKAEVEKATRESEQHTEASSHKPLETLGVQPSGIPPIQSTPPREPEIRILGLNTYNTRVKEITDKMARWNNSNKDKYSLAGWAWFKHSEEEALLLMGTWSGGYIAWSDTTRKRTGIIKLPEIVLRGLKLSAGYNDVIYGPRRENGARDIVKFE